MEVLWWLSVAMLVEHWVHQVAEKHRNASIEAEDASRGRWRESPRYWGSFSETEVRCVIGTRSRTKSYLPLKALHLFQQHVTVKLSSSVHFIRFILQKTIMSVTCLRRKLPKHALRCSSRCHFGTTPRRAAAEVRKLGVVGAGQMVWKIFVISFHIKLTKFRV